MTVNIGSALDVQDRLAVRDGSAIHLAGGTVFGGETSGGLLVAAGAQLAGYGTVQTASGSWLYDDGTIEATRGTLDLDGNVIGAGTILIGADSTVALAATRC